MKAILQKRIIIKFQIDDTGNLSNVQKKSVRS